MAAATDAPPSAPARPRRDGWGEALRQRWRRQRMLGRALWRGRELSPVADRSAAIAPGAILCLATVRNEAARLPWFLRHHRALGVDHFLIVDNDSRDGTAAALAAEPDVSLWHTAASYRGARFGMDWINALLMRHGHGHWCLTLDADELLVYPHCESRGLRALTAWLDRCGLPALPAMMLDLYPRGPLSAAAWHPGADPVAALGWFDAGNYTMRRDRLWNLWIQGGVRGRAFFAADPARAPTLGKTPLVRWHRRYAYVNATHTLLPRRLNLGYGRDGGELPSGVLLHTKYLPVSVPRAAEERLRRQHFHDPARFEDYYDRMEQDPDLWTPHSQRYRGWRQLEALGLMSRGGWV